MVVPPSAGWAVPAAPRRRSPQRVARPVMPSAPRNRASPRGYAAGLGWKDLTLAAQLPVCVALGHVWPGPGSGPEWWLWCSDVLPSLGQVPLSAALEHHGLCPLAVRPGESKGWEGRWAVWMESSSSLVSWAACWGCQNVPQAGPSAWVVPPALGGHLPGSRSAPRPR